MLIISFICFWSLEYCTFHLLFYCEFQISNYFKPLFETPNPLFPLKKKINPHSSAPTSIWNKTMYLRFRPQFSRKIQNFLVVLIVACCVWQSNAVLMHTDDLKLLSFFLIFYVCLRRSVNSLRFSNFTSPRIIFDANRCFLTWLATSQNNNVCLDVVHVSTKWKSVLWRSVRECCWLALDCLRKIRSTIEKLSHFKGKLLLVLCGLWLEWKASWLFLNRTPVVC